MIEIYEGRDRLGGCAEAEACLCEMVSLKEGRGDCDWLSGVRGTNGVFRVSMVENTDWTVFCVACRPK